MMEAGPPSTQHPRPAEEENCGRRSLRPKAPASRGGPKGRASQAPSLPLCPLPRGASGGLACAGNQGLWVADDS